MAGRVGIGEVGMSLQVVKRQYAGHWPIFCIMDGDRMLLCRQTEQEARKLLLEVGRDKKSEAGKKYGEGHPQEVMSTIDTTSHSTRDTIAADLGWSTGKVAMAEGELI